MTTSDELETNQYATMLDKAENDYLIQVQDNFGLCKILSVRFKAVCDNLKEKLVLKFYIFLII